MMMNAVRWLMAPLTGARSSGSRSRCNAQDVMSGRRVRPFVMLCAIALATVASVRPAVAQPAPDPSDPFFDDSVLQEIRLDINTRDWDTLKTNYLANDYFPCDFKWGTTIVRNVGI